MSENPAMHARPFAVVTLEVHVHLDTEPTRNIPGQARELGYDYFAVRQVEPVKIEEAPGANLRALALIEQAGFDDHDPDGLLKEALEGALLTLLPDPEET